MTLVRRAGVPPQLAAMPLRTLRAHDTEAVYAHPRSQLARLEQSGALHRVAYGVYVVVPQEYVGAEWMPTLEAAAAGIAAATFGAQDAALMSVSAARVHGAIPRALSTAMVAAPAQHAPLQLVDRDAVVRFVKRDVGILDVLPATTELGRALVTSVEQTVLDLARRPSLGVADDQIPEAIRALLAASDAALLTELAARQRKQAALRRARQWAE